ncbi:unnamed protein product [marine sediment metagenome]|uniref:HK97 gp10 family phage protein n=1 Tax=marine sediment metagenome TaxID=412755 RepID=X1BN79_9ZZZZ
MKIKSEVKMNLKTKEVINQVNRATEKAIKDVVVDIANDAIKGSPVETGNNRRSIKYEAKGLEGSIYSTSGYGGYLETGTVKMAAQPYFNPALDRNIHKLPSYIKADLR